MVFDSVIIKLIRKGAGVSPDYSLIISGRGLIIYEGKENVDKKGELEEKIDKEKVVKLLSEFKKIEFFSLNDIYPIENSEGRPSCIVSISITDKNGQTKTKAITHFHGDKNVPRKLLDLEDKIDKVANSKKWVGEPSNILQATDKPSIKKVESIVTKHEKTFEKRKKPLPKKAIAIVILFCIIILIGFVIIQSGFFNDLFNNESKNANQSSTNVAIEASHMEGYAPLIVHFTGIENNYNGSLSYLWDFDDGEISDEENPVHVFKNAGIYNVNYTVINSEGIKFSNNAQIIVKNKGPTQTLNTYITMIPASQIGTAPLNVSFTSNIQNGNPPFDFYWDLGNGVTIMNQNVNYTYISKGEYIVTLYITDSTGDSSSDEAEIHVI